MKLALSRLHFPVTTLGPGRRIGVWFQGCKIRCDGCVSVDTWAEGKGVITVGDVVQSVLPWLPQADGITVSGGEPFDQAEALDSLLQDIPLSSAQDVLVYSGYAFEHIEQLPAVRRGRIDALITDPFLLEARQTLPLRGSDNQRLHLLTERGQLAFSCFQIPMADNQRRLDVMFDNDGTVWLAGIPRPGDMHRLRHLLKSQGHEVRTSVTSNTAR